MIEIMHLNVSFFITVCLCSVLDVLSIQIEENAYRGISISFSEPIKEQHFNFPKFKQILQKSSEYLYHATKSRAYFQEFIVILPSTWTSDFCPHSTTESPDKVNIYVTNSREDLTTKHSKKCGQEGDMIYMPLPWLNGDTEDLSLQFLRQWSIYRYGVFEENPLQHDTCYVSPKNQFSPVGCYNVKMSEKPTFGYNGLASCDKFDESKLAHLKSSLMFKTNFSKTSNFCDGSVEFPHNPAMPTLHNNICEGKTVWSIIENSNDFKYGKNLPAKFPLPPSPIFKCFRKPKLHLTLAIQNSSTSDITLAVEEIRYTLYHYLRNLSPAQAAINLVTFSNDADNTEHVELNLNDEEELFKIMDKYVVTSKTVSDICLLCGIREALNVSQLNSHSSPVAVILALESAVVGQKTSEIVDVIQDNQKVQLHLVLIEDTENHVVPSDLVNAVRSTGGFLHSLPRPYLLNKQNVPNVLLYEQLNVVLSTVVKNPLQVDDKVVVVHEAIYKNGSKITDTFVTPPVTAGKLIYIMHCDLKGQISNRDPNCSLRDELSTTFKCGSVNELNDGTIRTWTYKFDIRSGVQNPICTSIALLLVASSPESVSLRGWLNEHSITPGENSVIIYAEIEGVSQEKVKDVLAYISGPGTDSSFKIELRDNGNGDPDVKEGDGIYSRYFISFKEKGTYVVTVSVSFISSNEKGLPKEAAASADLGIVYKKIIGSFSVLSNPSSVDIIPPNRVGDLRVVAIDHENGTATLQWTAPGNDYDFGKAMKYEIKSASHPAKLMDVYFDDEDTTLLMLLQKPQENGKLEIHEFHYPKINRDATYFVALRAEDVAGNKGKISNIVQIHIKKSSTDIPDPDISTPEVTSDAITISPISENSTIELNITSPEISTVSEISSTSGTNLTVTEMTWKDFLLNSKFITVASSIGGFLLFLIIINIIICCCCCARKKEHSSETVSKKSSLKPPYNLNIAYQQESQSICESDIGASISVSEDQRIYSTTPTQRTVNANPTYSYHTSKSLSSKSKSPTDSELGFKLVEVTPAYATRSLSRFARRLNEVGVEGDITPSAAQPQQPKNFVNNSETQMYSLGVV